MSSIDILFYHLMVGIAEDIRRGYKSGSEFVLYHMPYIAL